MYAVDHVKLVYHIKDKIESLTKNWSCYFQFFCSISLFWAWPMHAWLSGNWQSHTYSTLIHIYRLPQTVRNITNEILTGKGLGMAVFWNFVVIFVFYNRHFIVVLDSAIRMSAFDSLV